MEKSTAKNTVIDNYSISFFDNMKIDKKTILFVHGWGADKSNLRAIYEPLSNKYRVISIDLPGFGKSSTPTSVITSIDYMNIVYKFIISLNIDKLSYVGHSFGGKIGILLSSHYPQLISNLILIDSSGIKPKHNIIWYLKVVSYKIMKFFIINIIHKPKILENLQNKIGSDDYRNAGKMRNILVKVVNEDISKELTKITCPTFLYWGDKDEATPLWMAHKMNKLIQDSGLYVVKGAGHFSFLKDLRIIDIIDSMIK